MGTSTDGILFFGFNIDDSWSEAEEFDNDFKELKYFKLTGKRDYYDNYSKNYDMIEEVFKSVEIDSHCSGDHPIYYVSCRSYVAHRGHTEEINLKKLIISVKELNQLKEYCKLMGIEWETPKWYLVSNWN